MAEEAVQIMRGGNVESVAYADAAVVDSLGHLVAWVGDPERATFWRSSAKPVQAMAVVLSGAASDFSLSGPELAMITASHGGEPRHVQQVRQILEKISVPEDSLICGPHWPTTAHARQALRDAGEQPTRIHNNCSGKHAGMMMLARQLQVEAQGYEQPTHPVQEKIFRVVKMMTGTSPGQALITGTDGCGVPTFFLPLARMAFAYAQLADPRGLEIQDATAASILAETVRRYPEMISGDGRLEVRLAETTNHRFIAKIGAEAIVCVGVPERGWGIALKMADGNDRTLASALLALLAELDLLDQESLTSLHDTMFPVLRNHGGDEVGSMRPVLSVHRTRLSVTSAKPRG